MTRGDLEAGGPMRRFRRLAIVVPPTLVGMAIGFIAGGGSDAGAATPCSVPGLQGTYGVSGSGVAFGSPWAAIGTIAFDGAGGVLGTLTENSGGEIDDATFKGTYSINPDCRGSLAFGMDHKARAGGGSHSYRHDVHTVDFVTTSALQRIFWVVVDTYSEGIPSSVPTTPDPAVTASGFLERI